MIEEWKCIKEHKSKLCNKQSLHIPGDKIYVSNTGKVRLNDIELTLDRGLYIRNGEIKIVGCSWPYKTMHRTIYTLFVGEPHHDVWHNIHHIDCNHFNNNVDNLIELTSKEHGDIHAGTIKPLYDIDWLKEQEARADNVIKETKEWLKNRVEEYLSIDRTSIYLNNKKKEAEQKQKQRNKEREDKLASGNYTLSIDGRLVPKTNAKKGYVMSKDEKQKHSIANKQAYIDRPELRELCCGNKGKHRCFDETTQKYFYK